MRSMRALGFLDTTSSSAPPSRTRRAVVALDRAPLARAAYRSVPVIERRSRRPFAGGDRCRGDRIGVLETIEDLPSTSTVRETRGALGLTGLEGSHRLDALLARGVARIERDETSAVRGSAARARSRRRNRCRPRSAAASTTRRLIASTRSRDQESDGARQSEELGRCKRLARGDHVRNVSACRDAGSRN
jgi:hypothetical protein